MGAILIEARPHQPRGIARPVAEEGEPDLLARLQVGNVGEPRHGSCDLAGLGGGNSIRLDQRAEVAGLGDGDHLLGDAAGGIAARRGGLGNARYVLGLDPHGERSRVGLRRTGARIGHRGSACGRALRLRRGPDDLLDVSCGNRD